MSEKAKQTVETHAPAEIDLEDGEYIYQTQRHRNGDETAVLLTAFGEGWQAIAVDVAGDGEILDLEIIGHAGDETRAVGMCEYWLEQHPDGVLGGAPEGEGLGDRIMDLMGGGS